MLHVFADQRTFKMGHLQRWGTVRTVPKFLCCSTYCLFCVILCIVRVCICVLYYCHQVSTQLHLTNISYHVQVLLKKAGVSNWLG